MENLILCRVCMILYRRYPIKCKLFGKYKSTLRVLHAPPDDFCVLLVGRTVKLVDFRIKNVNRHPGKGRKKAGIVDMGIIIFCVFGFYCFSIYWWDFRGFWSIVYTYILCLCYEFGKQNMNSSEIKILQFPEF